MSTTRHLRAKISAYPHETQGLPWWMPYSRQNPATEYEIGLVMNRVRDRKEHATIIVEGPDAASAAARIQNLIDNPPSSIFETLGIVWGS